MCQNVAELLENQAKFTANIELKELREKKYSYHVGNINSVLIESKEK